MEIGGWPGSCIYAKLLVFYPPSFQLIHHSNSPRYMPITKSAKKALRQNATRRARNLKSKRNMKDVVKQFRKLVEQKKSEEASALLSRVYKTLDKTAKKGVIKKNTASRLKSRLAKRLIVSK